MIRKIAIIIINALFFSIFNQGYAENLPLPKMINKNYQLNIKPSWLVINDVYFYDADTDDMVTAGYGFSQLSGSRMDSIFADKHNPTPVELRRAKLNRYIDTKTGEGYFFGFKTNKLTPLFDGKVAGTEVQAYLDNGNEKVAFLLQIPLDFDKKKPCIVAIPTMDAEGIYNARDIQIRGLWGLSHHCAVVYNDKGLGNALFDLSNKSGYLVNGMTASQSAARDELLFSPEAMLDTNFMLNRYATKQLHSQQNPEAKWGEYVIHSLEFAFYYLNVLFAQTHEVVIDRNNTYVLVYGASDGGGAALKAGEYDSMGLIDGIVAVNPQIQISMNTHYPLFIQHGTSTKEALSVKSLIDYSSYAALYFPCAVLALKNKEVGNSIPYLDKYFFSENRCNALKKNQLLITETEQEQAIEALHKLYQYGWTAEMVKQLPYHYFEQSINLPYQYISSYGRYGVSERLCGYSVASTNQAILFNQGDVSSLSKASFSLLWAKNTGSLPVRVDNDTVALDLVNDDDPISARRELYSRSKSGEVVDYNLTGAICLRNAILERRVQEGQSAVFSTGQLNQIKTIIVHGQLNVKNLPNYSARAYVALNSYMEGSFSNLKYIEVENASYIDSVRPFDNTLISIDFYGENAMDLLWASVVKDASLPDSQVIRTKVRGGKNGSAPAVNKDNLPSIMLTPRQENRVTIDNGTIILPN